MNEHTSDTIVIGGGIIGLSIALALRRRGASVRVLERGEPGREASWAGAGMLAARDPETPECLRELARASEQMYPAWVERIEHESGMKADLRREGTIYLLSAAKEGLGRDVPPEKIKELEPGVRPAQHCYVTEEGSVDPRSLMAALLQAAKTNGVVISHEHAVSSVDHENGIAKGVRCGNKNFAAHAIVNCAGAWANEVEGVTIAALPVKGHMLSVVGLHGHKPALNHVVRGDEIYLVPRSDGRTLIGATVERAGFDKRVVPEAILRMRNLAAALVPEISQMQIHESWTGLRPGLPDKLPILGETPIKNYFVATGHYRNGILLAPVTGEIMSDVLNGCEPKFDIRRFEVNRFI